MAEEGWGVAPESPALRSQGGPRLALHRWRVDRPHAVCLLVHGYAGHAGRYPRLVRALGEAGLESYAVDLRGHGRSAGTRADVRDFGDYLHDLAALEDHARSERPGLPVLLFGHSMGGTVALRYALERPERVDALVLSAPFLRASVPPPGWLLAVARWLARALPQLPVQPLDPAALSRDPESVTAYREDPLIYTGRIKARMGHALVTAGEPLLARAGALSVPTLIVHGGADQIADPRASQELAAAIPDANVTFRLYQGGYHELLNDLERERVLADILEWVRAQSSLQPSSTRSTRNLR